jgi:2-polyprenyl-3-methyl-5-hydroxy-6-metoxy-1,4-benzoquinol methylase
MNREEHWNNIYSTKEQKEFSWFQPKPQTSLDLIRKAGLTKDAAIIDVGGGDGLLVDSLLEEGYTNITVLDISSRAIARAKARLGEKATAVTWIVADIVDFKPERYYDLWHDRAVFHFLTNVDEQHNYSTALYNASREGSHLILSTFSTKGPKKCSGLEIAQYNEDMLADYFQPHFEKLSCFEHTHKTPWDSDQVFQFCHFLRKDRQE